MATKRKYVKTVRRVRPDGSVWYYYHKRKPGPKKHRGPKKKKPVVEKPAAVKKPFNYQIVRFDMNKRRKTIGKYREIEEAYEKKDELLEQNKSVVFPRMFTNNGRNDAEIFDLKSEYLILAKNVDDKDPSKLRNEYGKFVTHVLDDNEWLIIDKFPCLEEETFWAYGFDQKKDRKTVEWIYDNFVLKHIEDSFSIVNIYVYNNKVLFRYDFNEFNFVICKNISDAIRMYNFMQEKAKKIKKQVIFTGFVKGWGDSRGKDTIKMIKQKTGWKDKKIWERSTRH